MKYKNLLIAGFIFLLLVIITFLSEFFTEKAPPVSPVYGTYTSIESVEIPAYFSPITITPSSDFSEWVIRAYDNDMLIEEITLRTYDDPMLAPALLALEEAMSSRYIINNISPPRSRDGQYIETSGVFSSWTLKNNNGERTQITNPELIKILYPLKEKIRFLTTSNK